MTAQYLTVAVVPAPTITANTIVCPQADRSLMKKKVKKKCLRALLPACYNSFVDESWLVPPSGQQKQLPLLHTPKNRTTDPMRPTPTASSNQNSLPGLYDLTSLYMLLLSLI